MTTELTAPQSLPRVVVVDELVRSGESVHISVLSDLHLESRLADSTGLRRLLEERAQLEHHHVVLIGDVLDLVGHEDTRRYRHGGQIDRLAQVDAWVNEALEHAVETLTVDGIRYDLISPGNHEDTFLQRHGIDTTSVLANRLGARRGGFSGVLDYRIRLATPNQRITGTKLPYVRFRVLYHHGAWGGRLAKGYNGASPWAAQWDGWHVFAFGHSHGSRHDVEVRHEVTQDGHIRRYEAHIVNASSWVDSYADDALVTHYAELRGYLRQPRKSPLITVTPAWCHNRLSMKYFVTV